VNLRLLRLRAVWLLVLPFLWLARPSAVLLAVGAAFAALGLAVRAWAAGTIRKDAELATAGPYAYTRNPLYLGSLLLGVGVATAGGHWVWPVLFVAFWVAAYGSTIAAEGSRLASIFGERYATYAVEVPALRPRVTPWREPAFHAGGARTAGGEGTRRAAGFTWTQYRRNREWEALLGAVAGFAILVAKWALGTP